MSSDVGKPIFGSARPPRQQTETRIGGEPGPVIKPSAPKSADGPKTVIVQKESAPIAVPKAGAVDGKASGPVPVTEPKAVTVRSRSPTAPPKAPTAVIADSVSTIDAARIKFPALPENILSKIDGWIKRARTALSAKMFSSYARNLTDEVSEIGSILGAIAAESASVDANTVLKQAMDWAQGKNEGGGFFAFLTRRDDVTADQIRSSLVATRSLLDRLLTKCAELPQRSAKLYDELVAASSALTAFAECLTEDEKREIDGKHSLLASSTRQAQLYPTHAKARIEEVQDQINNIDHMLAVTLPATKLARMKK